MKFSTFIYLFVIIFSNNVNAFPTPTKVDITNICEIDTAMNIEHLFSAAKTGDLPTFVKALKSGISVNESNHTGTTALMIAAKYGNIHIVKELLKKGAKVETENNTGLTALDFARLYKRKEIVSYLSKEMQNY